MKQLLVIRHGKSSWDMNGLTDHDRPLNERGNRDVPRMAEALKERGIEPGHIASSTAVRAATTAQAIANGLGYEADRIAYDRSIYLASPGAMLRVIQQFDESVETALIFGHNPGMHELVNQLASSDWIESFPTLAVGWLKLNVEFWGEVDFGCGELVETITPRLLN